MGALTLWQKLAPTTDADSDAHVPLDAILPTGPCSALREFYDSSPLFSDALAEADWAFAAQRYLDSGAARYGARVATCDPHAVELGAYGIAAFHQTPAALVTRGRERHQPVADARRILVRVNDPLPAGCDPLDVGLRVGLESGPAGFAGAVLSFEGPGIELLTMSERRRLLAAAASSGCLTALGPIDERARQAWWQLPIPHPPSPEEFVRLRPDPDAAHHELVVVNGGGLRPLAFEARSATIRALSDVGDAGPRRIAIGGCVAGDLDALRSSIEALELRSPRPGTQLYLVPASEYTFRLAQQAGLDERALSVGALMCPPSAVGPDLDAATSPCLANDALVASPLTLIASASAGRLSSWEEP